MSVHRISPESVRKILNGGVADNDTTTVVIKFYSNGCHYCHALSEYFVNLSNDEKYEDIYFFASNVDSAEAEAVTKTLKLNGVPSIALLKTRGGRCIKTKLLPDPDTPHETTWYTVKEIKKFIDSER